LDIVHEPLEERCSVPHNARVPGFPLQEGVKFHCACIFPEGTRSRTGALKPFSPKGVQIILKYAPSALVVPVTIDNSWRLTAKGWFPMGVGFRIKWTFHEPIQPKGKSASDVLNEAERLIQTALPTSESPASQPHPG
ncbi:MAG: hypothetical protein AAF399_05120, partial [Bacteroidota bacterium]